MRYLILFLLISCASEPWPEDKRLYTHMTSFHPGDDGFFYNTIEFPVTECIGTRENKRWCRMDYRDGFETCWIDTFEYEPPLLNKQQTRHNDKDCVYYYGNGGVRR